MFMNRTKSFQSELVLWIVYRFKILLILIQENKFSTKITLLFVQTKYCHSKISNNTSEYVGVNLGSACIPSGSATDGATMPGLLF